MRVPAAGMSGNPVPCDYYVAYQNDPVEALGAVERTFQLVTNNQGPETVEKIDVSTLNRWGLQTGDVRRAGSI